MIDSVISVAFLIILPAFVLTSLRSRKQATRDAALLKQAAKDINVSAADLRDTVAELNNKLSAVRNRHQNIFISHSGALNAGVFYELISHWTETSSFTGIDRVAEYAALYDRRLRAADWSALACVFSDTTEIRQHVEEWQVEPDTLNVWKKLADVRPSSNIRTLSPRLLVVANLLSLLKWPSSRLRRVLPQS